MNESGAYGVEEIEVVGEAYSGNESVIIAASPCSTKGAKSKKKKRGRKTSKGSLQLFLS